MVSSSAIAELRANAEPLALRNTNPFIQIFGLPPMESGRIIPKGKNKFQLTFDLANNSISAASSSENLKIIGQSYRASLIWKRGLSPDLEIGAEIPYIIHRGGFTDTTARPTYKYSRGDDQVVSLTNNNSGLGDIRVFAGKAFISSADRELKARVSFDIPTGDDRKLHSNSDVDFAISLAGTENKLLTKWDTTLFAHAGLLVIGQNPGSGPAIKKVRRETALFAGISLNRKYNEYIDAKIQLEGHTPMYRSSLRQLGRASTLLTVGGTLHIDTNTTLDFSIGSNLFTNVAPDFPFHFALSRHF